MNRAVACILAVILSVVVLAGCGGGTTGTGGDGHSIVRGAVVNTVGEQVAGAEVQIAETGDRATTDSGGSFRIEADLEGDRFTLQVTQGQQTAQAPLVVEASRERPVDVDVRITIDSATGGIVTAPPVVRPRATPTPRPTRTPRPQPTVSPTAAAGLQPTPPGEEPSPGEPLPTPAEGGRPAPIVLTPTPTPSAQGEWRHICGATPGTFEHTTDPALGDNTLTIFLRSRDFNLSGAEIRPLEPICADLDLGRMPQFPVGQEPFALPSAFRTLLLSNRQQSLSFELLFDGRRAVVALSDFPRFASGQVILELFAFRGSGDRLELRLDELSAFARVDRFGRPDKWMIPSARPTIVVTGATLRPDLHGAVPAAGVVPNRVPKCGRSADLPRSRNLSLGVGIKAPRAELVAGNISVRPLLPECFSKDYGFERNPFSDPGRLNIDPWYMAIPLNYRLPVSVRVGNRSWIVELDLSNAVEFNLPSVISHTLAVELEISNDGGPPTVTYPASLWD